MRSRRRGLILTLIIGLLGWAGVKPQAQVTTLQTVSPFDDVGLIQAATVTPAPDKFSGGGTITVNGIVMTVPRNTILQMPAFALTWQEVFEQAPAAYQVRDAVGLLLPASQSGLAMADGIAGGTPPPPLTTYEVHVMGNRVGDQYIVGLMFIAQQSVNAGVGFINFIDYANGEMRVGGTIGGPTAATTGARVRINDPLGKFGTANAARPNALTDNHDDRFTIDADNPTVRSETAYPMCVPRTNPFNPDGTFNPLSDDPKCPQANRPKGTDGNYKSIFTMDALPFDGSAPLGTNPLLMMPFEVGDYVTYNGTLASDALLTPAGTYVSAWGVIANVGVLTSPGTQPVYTAIDVMKLGTGGIPLANMPQEAAVRTRIEGFTTDPTSFIDLFATDVDACTGAQTLRYYATVGVDNLVKLGRWRWRPNTDLAFLPPTRMLTAISENGIYTDPSTFNLGTPIGLLAGFYTAPNFEFITPENLGIGRPKVPANFQDFPFLSSGSGPYPAPGPGALGRLGQLSPWPGAAAPVAPTCSGPGGTALFTPIVDPGLNQSVLVSTLAAPTVVTLDGLNSKDTTQPLKLPLSYTWKQVAVNGVPVVCSVLPRPAGCVVLSSAFSPTPRFTAPSVPTLLTFNLSVTTNGNLTSSNANVNVDVTATPIPTDVITLATATFRIRRAQLTVTATTSDPTAVLTVEGFGDMGPALALSFIPFVPAPLTNRLYRQVGVDPIPTTVTIRSNRGGTATVAVRMR